jgi:branched-subunit amino acid aminotransferase/4-amino-4-deoxychorismate lyase
VDLKEITRENVFRSLDAEERAWQQSYLAMYSSLWGGFTTDPALMTVPLDDHLVHRGDGVFDTMRCVQGRIYRMASHLERLEGSAGAISLPMPHEYERVRDIVGALVVRGGQRDCVIRITLSRGPGSYSTNPFDCPSSQMYVVVIRYKDQSEEMLNQGTCIVTSRVPPKRSFYARIKSCNYLPNVLMKMEAVQGGCPYAVALDEDGFLTEGSTENVGILSPDGTLKFPGFERTLAGTTVTRVFDLARSLVEEGLISGVRFDRIPLEEAYAAREVMLMGTSINVLPVVRFDGRPVGDGRPGPVSSELSRLLWKDMTENVDMLTDLDWPDAGS